MKLPKITQKIQNVAKSINGLPKIAKIGIGIFGGLAGTATILACDHFEKSSQTPKVTKEDAEKHFNENYKEKEKMYHLYFENGDCAEEYDKMTPRQKVRTYANGQVKREKVYIKHEGYKPEERIGYPHQFVNEDFKWKELVKEVKYNNEGDTIYYFNKYDSK